MVPGVAVARCEDYAREDSGRGPVCASELPPCVYGRPIPGVGRPSL